MKNANSLLFILGKNAEEGSLFFVLFSMPRPRAGYRLQQAVAARSGERRADRRAGEQNRPIVHGLGVSPAFRFCFFFFFFLLIISVCQPQLADYFLFPGDFSAICRVHLFLFFSHVTMLCTRMLFSLLGESRGFDRSRCIVASWSLHLINRQQIRLFRSWSW